jgi:hypothetical protein
MTCKNVERVRNTSVADSALASIVYACMHLPAAYWESSNKIDSLSFFPSSSHEQVKRLHMPMSDIQILNLSR